MASVCPGNSPPGPCAKTGVGTTTLSTIAVQSGTARIVIALLQAGNSVHLKVVEMKPEIGWLGDSFSEAAALQSAQTEVITKLQSKQSPVEELLRQADQLITNQQPRAEVYAAMADSLGAAWRDLNRILEERKLLLDQNYSFQGHFQVALFASIEEVYFISCRILKNMQRSCKRYASKQEAITCQCSPKI